MSPAAKAAGDAAAGVQRGGYSRQYQGNLAELGFDASNNTDGRAGAAEAPAETQQYQQKLFELSAERDKALSDLRALTKVTTRQRSEWQDAMKRESDGHASEKSKLRDEVTHWKIKADKLTKRYRELQQLTQTQRQANGDSRSSPFGSGKAGDNHLMYDAVGMMEAAMAAPQAHKNPPPSTPNDYDAATAEALNNELLIKMSAMSEENALIAQKCKQLEAEKESKMGSRYTALVEELQSDKEALKRRVEELQLKHNDTTRELEDRIAQLAEENEILRAPSPAGVAAPTLNPIMEVDEARLARLSDLETEHSFLRSENEELKSECRRWEDKYNALLGTSDKLATRCDELTAQNDSVSAQCQDLKEELMSTKDELADALLHGTHAGPSNDPVTAKIQSEALAAIEELQLENECLQQSMDENMKVMMEMNTKMVEFASRHEESVQSYEDKLKALEDELGRAMESERELRAECDEARQTSRRALAELEEARREADAAREEREEAYRSVRKRQTCFEECSVELSDHSSFCDDDDDDQGEEHEEEPTMGNDYASYIRPHAWGLPGGVASLEIDRGDYTSGRRGHPWNKNKEDDDVSSIGEDEFDGGLR